MILESGHHVSVVRLTNPRFHGKLIRLCQLIIIGHIIYQSDKVPRAAARYLACNSDPVFLFLKRRIDICDASFV